MEWTCPQNNTISNCCFFSYSCTKTKASRAMKQADSQERCCQQRHELQTKRIPPSLKPMSKSFVFVQCLSTILKKLHSQCIWTVSGYEQSVHMNSQCIWTYRADTVCLVVWHPCFPQRKPVTRLPSHLTSSLHRCCQLTIADCTAVKHLVEPTVTCLTHRRHTDWWLQNNELIKEQI